MLLAAALPSAAQAEQASQPSSPLAAQLDAGGSHTCAIVDGRVYCWGLGFSGQLGYGNTANVGDDEAAGASGAVDLGAGRTATAISAGDFHTCALLDDGSVRCWGFGANGRLGYGNTQTIGDDETPASAGAVNLGGQATAISAGGSHTCAVLVGGSVRCWGFGPDGRLGYATEDPTTFISQTVGDDEAPASVAPVDLGGPATAISVGGEHTCAVLVGGSVRCWGDQGGFAGGDGGDGRLGYANGEFVGDNETPASVGPVNVGGTVTAISAGDWHTCAVLTGGSVRCWGLGRPGGRIGYPANLGRGVGDDEVPASVGPVDLGAGRTATAISAGNHSCARLDNGTLRCWGPGGAGRLGYGNTEDVGDNESPGSVGPVNVGGTVAAVSAGGTHTCARLDDASLRCWGEGTYGRLGYASERDIGDDEVPAAAGPVDLDVGVSVGDASVTEGNSGDRTLTFEVRLSAAAAETATVAYSTADASARAPADYTARSGALTFVPGETSKTVIVTVKGDAADEPDERFRLNLSNPTNATITRNATGTIVDDDPTPVTYPSDSDAAARQAEAARLRGLRTCYRRASRHARRDLRRARRLKGSRRARAMRHARRHKASLRRACVKRWGRTPGRVTALQARASSEGEIVITFKAAGTDGTRPPAARGYVVKQSRRAIRSARAFRRAGSLCGGTCRFPTARRVGATLILRVTDLRPGTRYHYAIAARDNVSRRVGPRSADVSATTR